jgi:hypothetical protein
VGKESRISNFRFNIWRVLRFVLYPRRSTLHSLLFTLALVALLAFPASPVLADPPPPHLGYGLLVGNIANAGRVAAMGFGWIKSFIYWMSVQPEPEVEYDWGDLHNIVNAAGQNDLHLLVRIDGWRPGAGVWALDTSAAGNNCGQIDYAVRAEFLPQFQAFMQALAAEARAYMISNGYTIQIAYEIWNEPNLDREWGCLPVDPQAYVDVLASAYDGVKAGDPKALVLTAGLAPTGGLPNGQALNDIEFLQQMYATGQLRGKFDAVAIHNYGFACAPEEETCNGADILTFRRAEDYYAVMVEQGDGGKQVWSTEYGWLHDPAEFNAPSCMPTSFQWMILPKQTVADYLVRSFQYADANWPWMGPMFVSNLDFATVWPLWGWCEPLVWFSIINPDLPGGVLDPRPAYTALAEMPKRPAAPGPRMSASPSSLSFVAVYSQPVTWTAPIYVDNVGYATFTWTVQSPSGTLAWMGISPTVGVAGQAFTVTLSNQGLATSAYTSVLTVTAYATTTVANSPKTIPVTLRVFEQLYRIDLPLILHTR